MKKLLSGLRNGEKNCQHLGNQLPYSSQKLCTSDSVLYVLKTIKMQKQGTDRTLELTDA